MAQVHTQISAYISEETKNSVERYARARGVKKGFLDLITIVQLIPPDDFLLVLPHFCLKPQARVDLHHKL